MKGFPKTLKTKEDFYNCLAMVARGELAAADLLAKIESAEKQRFICCQVVEVAAEKKAITVMYCDEAAVGMKFTAGNVSGSIAAVGSDGSRPGRKRPYGAYSFQGGGRRNGNHKPGN